MDSSGRQQALQFAEQNLQPSDEKEKAFEYLDDTIKDVMDRVMCEEPEKQIALYDYLYRMKVQNTTEKRLKTKKENKEREKA